MAGEWPHELDERLPAYLGGQRWFSGAVAPPRADVEVVATTEMWSDAGGDHRLWHVLVAVAEDLYQLVIGERPEAEQAEFLHGHEEALIGRARGSHYYDATVDPDLARHLLECASDGREVAALVRPLGVEQSNTSLVFDDRIIFKIFRRLHRARNPEVEVSTALAAAGFTHVATPLVEWREGGYDLGYGQQYLVGATDGWALALTSLRDLFNADRPGTPGEAGGDFGAEAERLGRVTADMHLALAEVFGPASAAETGARWRALVSGLAGRLERAGASAGVDFLSEAGALLARLEAVEDPGPGLRVHGDFHLGQVMRTDDGWYVLDFEGEPARAVEERVAPTSVLKDVTSMLRSLHYASLHALGERTRAEWAELGALAAAWESHNRGAFLDGYWSCPGVDALMPASPARPAVMAAYELDKALYELDYEMAHRPDWVFIPRDALERLIGGGAPGTGRAGPAGDDPGRGGADG